MTTTPPDPPSPERPPEIPLTYAQLRETGLLWKINTALHPLGLGLAVGSYGSPESMAMSLTVQIATDGYWEFLPEVNEERSQAFQQWYTTTCLPLMTDRGDDAQP